LGINGKHLCKPLRPNQLFYLTLYIELWTILLLSTRFAVVNVHQHMIEIKYHKN